MTMTHREALKESVKAWLKDDDADGFITSAIDGGHVGWISEAEAALRAYVEARGLVLVPMVATDEMLEEGKKMSDFAVGCYQTMLASAPDPFAQEERA